MHAVLKNSVSFAALLAASSAVAGEAGTTMQNPDEGVFGLGQIEQVKITAALQSQAVSESKITRDDIYKFNAQTLDRALDLTTGVETGQTGGVRNERLFFIRGFDRFQSVLFIDGIRVYLPVDNRLDIGFFPTANISQIQVEKGYVSVLAGPGAMGGALNIVTRKPTQSLEYEAQGGISMGMDGYNGYNASALIGGKMENWYAQASVAVTNLDHFSLSDDYIPTASQGAGIRLHSDNRNYSANLKVGYTPNDTDEYSLSYSGTWGQKSAPFSVNDAISGQKDWRWPYWDIQNIYFLSNTTFGTAYVKTKGYYTSFRNSLISYDNANYNTQTTSKAFSSYYSDYGEGGSIEAGNNFGRDVLKGAFFFRRDNHDEYQIIYSPAFTEPHQVTTEDTYSIALENRFHVNDQVDFVVGGSYDWRHLLEAQEYTDPTKPNTPGTPVTFPLADADAPNVQGALIYNYSDTGHVHGSISDRARFPTIMERFSTRFGSTLSNPGLKAERAINYEIGAGDTFFGNTRVDGAVFYSDVQDALINVPILFCDTTSSATPKNCLGVGNTGTNNGISSASTQTQNVGNGKYLGFELSGDGRVLDNLLLGVRFTYINRHIDAQNPANPALPATFHLTGVPATQLMAYATWDVLPNVSITPNVQLDSDRWSNQSSNNNVYIKTGAYFLLNLQANWAITDQIDMQAGARNLTDSNYQLTAGFPNEGRSFFVNFRFRN